MVVLRLKSVFPPLQLRSMDNLLDSGLYTGEITELCGGPGTGKTQVSFPIQTHQNGIICSRVKFESADQFHPCVVHF